MKRGLGLDFGAKRIGTAIGEIVAMPYVLIPYESNQKLLAQLRLIIGEENIDYIVVGLPQTTRHSQSLDDALRVKEFLTKNLSQPVYGVDETLSTFVAESELAQAGHKPASIKKHNDCQAAAIILQQYIDENN